jgi:hypothetical protein
MPGRGDTRAPPPPNAASAGLEQWIHQTVSQCRRRAKRLYRTGLVLRAVILVCAFLAVLPDSALFKTPGIAAAYGTLTSVAGATGALLFILANNLRVVETITVLNEMIAYLEDQSMQLLTRDGLSRQVAEVEIRKELAAREAGLQQGVFAGLDRYFGSWGRQGG